MRKIRLGAKRRRGWGKFRLDKVKCEKAGFFETGRYQTLDGFLLGYDQKQVTGRLLQHQN